MSTAFLVKLIGLFLGVLARTALPWLRKVRDGRVRGFGRRYETLRRLMVKARQEPLRIVFSDGANDTIQRAAAILADEGMAQPILLGDEGQIRDGVARLGLDPTGLTVVDPARSPRGEEYAAEYLKLRRRRGVMPPTAAQRLRPPEYCGAMMVHGGDADMLMCGIEQHYADSLRVMLETIGPGEGVHRVSSYYLVLLPRDVYALGDCAVNIDQAAEDLAETALLTARTVRASSWSGSPRSPTRPSSASTWWRAQSARA